MCDCDGSLRVVLLGDAAFLLLFDDWAIVDSITGGFLIRFVGEKDVACE